MSWDQIPFEEAVRDQTGGNKKVVASNYLKTGRLPVIDQGQGQIAGYIDDLGFRCDVPLPCILFGDHTKLFKYVCQPFALGADGVKVLVPSERFDPKFTFHYLRTVRFPGDAGYSRHFKFLKRTTIPCPPLEEQKRIAAILDKADAIRRKREQAIELADEFLRSLFLDMFGDPVTNPMGWLQRPLGECVSMENGSTPSKDVPAYWGGLIPWVTPKDMKIDEIADSIDHISQRAVEEQRAKIVPVDSVLIVVRGMILAHTVPIARNLAPCTINQDMKALRPSKLLDPVFLASALRCLHNTLLSKVTTSTHGTKKLDSEFLRDLILPVPDLGLQSRFRQASDRACEFRNMALESSQATEILRSSLSNRAFRSEL